MNKPTLTAEDYARAAAALDVDVAAVRAVDQVEAPRGGFLPDGQVTILFERHKFSAYTGGRWDKAHPDISNTKRGGYLGGAAEHRRLQKAVALDRDAALRATSWGKYQILGTNYRLAGFATLQDFINAMHAGEPEQLAAFVAFVKAQPPMHRALKRRDWAAFAKAFNGPAQVDYDVRLAAAYRKFGGK